MTRSAENDAAVTGTTMTGAQGTRSTETTENPQQRRLLSVADLQISYRSGSSDHQAVRGVSFGIDRAETVALVGESGSGKTTIGRAILGLHRRSTQLTGSIRFDGTELIGASQARWRGLRGRRIALIPQDPLAGLNPVQPIGVQVAETLISHRIAHSAQARKRAVALLQRAGLARAGERFYHYPFQLSGGERQRVLIAIALSGEPQLIIADEPTSALDVTVQQRILDHLQELVRSSGTSLLLITHDLGVATDRTESVVVLNQGTIVEQLPSAQLLDQASDPYTQRLVAAAPRIDSLPLVQRSDPQARPDHGVQPLIQAQGLSKSFTTGSAQATRAVDAVDLSLYRGQTLGIVGESGSGKTTVARMLLGLTQPDAGSLRIAGESGDQLNSRAGQRRRRRVLQPVFQDPYSSLDPSHSIATSIAEPLRALGMTPMDARTSSGSDTAPDQSDTAEPGQSETAEPVQLSRTQRRRRVEELVETVQLPRTVLERKPYELSGGQLQRVAIARALAVNPQVLICDEPVSSLDVSVQDQILRLLVGLNAEQGMSYLLISHDLAVVRQICADVAVMRQGRVLETGPTQQIFAAPQQPYTQELIAAIPGQVSGGSAR